MSIFSRLFSRDDIDETVSTVRDGQFLRVGFRDTVDVDGASAFDIANDRVILSNAGDISTTNASAAIDVAGDDARIVNGPSGDITATSGDGVNASAITVTGSARVTNFGDIDGDFNAVNFAGADAGGSLTNFRSGTITSDSRAVNIDGDGVVVSNFGTILGTGDQRNGTVYSNDTASNYTLINGRSGLIDAGVGNDGAGFSLSLLSGGASGVNTVINRGEIAGRGQAAPAGGTAGDGVRLEADDVDATGLFEGRIFNAGAITSESLVGPVGGFRAVNGLDFAGELVNARGGEISGANNGVYFGTGDHSEGEVVNFGLIASDSRAFNIDGDRLEIDNFGTILGTGNQRNGTVYADETAQDFVLNNLASGVIDAGEGLEGAGFSVELAEEATGGNAFVIDNDGEIVGRGNVGAGAATAGDGLRFERTRVDGALDGTTTGLFDGVVTNSGDITSEGANGTVAGVRFVNGTSFQGVLFNEEGGSIDGVQNGIYFGNPTPAGGGDHSGGLVVNEGLVASDSRAFNLDGDGLAVVNDGDIVGTGDQRNGTFYGDATADDFTVLNLTDGVIDAGEGNDGSAFAFQTGDFDGDVVDGFVFNAGLAQGQGDSDEANGLGHGLRFNDGAANAAFDGIVLNTGTIAGSADNADAAGVSIENISFSGVIANLGTISGLETAIDASSANGVNIVNAGEIDGDVVLSGADDTFVVGAGSSIDGVVDGGAGDGDTLVFNDGTDADGVAALLAAGDFVGFENVLIGDDAVLDVDALVAAAEDLSLALEDAFDDFDAAEGAAALTSANEAIDAFADAGFEGSVFTDAGDLAIA